jgi:hypothetical protein
MITNIAAATGKCFIKVNNQLIGAVDANKVIVHSNLDWTT